MAILMIAINLVSGRHAIETSERSVKTIAFHKTNIKRKLDVLVRCMTTTQSNKLP